MPLKNRLYRRSLLATTAIVSVSVVSAAADPILSAPGQAFLINNATETSAVINSSVPSVSVTGNGTLEATHGYQDFLSRLTYPVMTNLGLPVQIFQLETPAGTSPSFTTRIGALAAPAVIVNSDISGNITNPEQLICKRRFIACHSVHTQPITVHLPVRA